MTGDVVDHPSPRKHRWVRTETVFPADSVNGCEETHRFCEHCDVVKVTVHQPVGNPYRVWIHPSGQRWVGDGTPPCEGTKIEQLQKHQENMEKSL